MSYTVTYRKIQCTIPENGQYLHVIRWPTSSCSRHGLGWAALTLFAKRSLLAHPNFTIIACMTQKQKLAYFSGQ